MVFSSSLFLLYFLPVFLAIYYLLPYKSKNTFIVIASILFYSWSGALYVLFLLASLLFDFYIAKYIHDSTGKKRKQILAFSVIINVGLLLYFKYANFFIENVNTALSSAGMQAVSWTKVALPIGISFFTFHKLSYTIDIYRGVKAPFTNIVNYTLYILLFPQLIAGPIIRFNEISDQIENREKELTIDNRLEGFYRFIVGLAKKVLIANAFGEMADEVFASANTTYSMQEAWKGALTYTFQIYFDFSGYSDMAIGIGLMMGFRFPENFNNPYISTSITDFWRRWHMTLSRWMKDYLYIPLGGNRVSTARMYFNLCTVFLISGFWHGASWNFIFWGAYHGVFQILDRLFLIKLLEKLPKIVQVLFTFVLVVIGWVFFRVDSIEQAFVIVKTMFDVSKVANVFEFGQMFWVMLVVGSLFSFIALWSKNYEALQRSWYNPFTTARGCVWGIVSALILFVFSVAEITSAGFNPFIYFRF